MTLRGLTAAPSWGWGPAGRRRRGCPPRWSWWSTTCGRIEAGCSPGWWAPVRSWSHGAPAPPSPAPSPRSTDTWTWSSCTPPSSLYLWRLKAGSVGGGNIAAEVARILRGAPSCEQVPNCGSSLVPGPALPPNGAPGNYFTGWGRETQFIFHRVNHFNIVPQ